MATNVNVQLTGASITVLDQATSTYRVNSPIGTLTLAATSATYDSFVPIANGAGTVLDLPASPVQLVYVKNLDGAANLTVQLTVQGGAQISVANSPVLLPGGVFMYWNVVETTNGIVAVTLISSVNGTAAEVLLAV